MTRGLQAEVLMRLREEGGAGLVRELAALLWRTVPARLARIRHGLDVGDQTIVQASAHSLKSAAGNFGASELAEAAARLEAVARGGAGACDADGLESAFGAVEAAWLEVADAVHQLAGGDR